MFPAMPELKELLQRHSREIEALLEREVPPDQTPYISKEVWYQFSSGGKRIRPSLCMIACDAFGGSTQDALPFALATEILHNFFLVHDDIEDGDTMRRDQPTLWTKVGVPNGINIGDYLIAKAYDLILKSSLPPETTLRLARIFTNTFQRTVEGQALDINLRGSQEVTLATYYRIVQLKTAYYLALPWVGGALIAGVDESVLESLWELGRCLGPAFQIRDDLLDLTDGKGRGGEIGCDLREGKPSIFYAYILDGEHGTTADRTQLMNIMARSRDETSADDVAWAIELFRRSGALDFAQKRAEELIAKGDEVIESVPLSEEGREVFSAISQYIVNRKT